MTILDNVLSILVRGFGRAISVLSDVQQRLKHNATHETKAANHVVLKFASKDLGQHTTTVIDVGARWGAGDAWWRLHPLAALVGFDPDPAECRRLNSLVSTERAEQYVPSALGHENGKATLHVSFQPACSSLYPPDVSLVARYPQLLEIREVSTADVTLKTMDTWWREAGKPCVSFVKLDTQGSELDILKGAEDLLEGCLGLEVEVEFSALYTGQPIFHEVDRFLREKGFALWRLSSLCHYSENPIGRTGKPDQVHFDGEWRSVPTGSGRLFWGNAVYFRDYESVTGRRNLLILAALLEGLDDRDGAAACLRRISTDVPKELIAQLESRS